MLKRVSSFVLVFVVASLFAGAAVEAWVDLGSRSVRSDRASYAGFPLSGRDRSFRELEVGVHDNSRDGLHVQDLEIEFTGGEIEDVAVDRFLRPGEATSVEIPGSERGADKVTIRFEFEDQERRIAILHLRGR